MYKKAGAKPNSIADKDINSPAKGKKIAEPQVN